MNLCSFFGLLRRVLSGVRIEHGRRLTVELRLRILLTLRLVVPIVISFRGIGTLATVVLTGVDSFSILVVALPSLVVIVVVGSLLLLLLLIIATPAVHVEVVVLGRLGLLLGREAARIERLGLSRLESS